MKVVVAMSVFAVGAVVLCALLGGNMIGLCVCLLGLVVLGIGMSRM